MSTDKTGGEDAAVTVKVEPEETPSQAGGETTTVEVRPEEATTQGDSATATTQGGTEESSAITTQVGGETIRVKKEPEEISTQSNGETPIVQVGPGETATQVVSETIRVKVEPEETNGQTGDKTSTVEVLPEEAATPVGGETIRVKVEPEETITRAGDETPTVEVLPQEAAAPIGGETIRVKVEPEDPAVLDGRATPPVEAVLENKTTQADGETTIAKVVSEEISTIQAASETTTVSVGLEETTTQANSGTSTVEVLSAEKNIEDDGEITIEKVVSEKTTIQAGGETSTVSIGLEETTTQAGGETPTVEVITKETTSQVNGETTTEKVVPEKITSQAGGTTTAVSVTAETTTQNNGEIPPVEVGLQEKTTPVDGEATTGKVVPEEKTTPVGGETATSKAVPEETVVQTGGETTAVKVVPEETTTQTTTMDRNKTENEPKIPATEDEEEEDIPPDFFDDFSNQDFMEGLDIVDTWDDAMQEEEGESKSYEESQHKDEGDDSSRANKRARITFSKERDQRSSRYKNYERGQRYKDLRDKIGRSDEARRRDPEKTRRDILRDKDRCAKDKEVKIMKERLKVVETGLVPPGMEMEVDLADIRSKQDSLNAESRNKLKTKVRSRSRSYDRYRYRERPLRSRTRSRSRERRRLHDRDDLSPVSRKRLRTRSRSRSPFYESRYLSSRERILSRERDRRLSRDRERKESGERRMSGERRYRRSPSPRQRQRSISPDRRRLDYKRDTPRRSDPESKENRPSFLEEIHRKLNEAVPHSSQIAVQQAMQLRANYASMQASQPVPLTSQPQPPFAPQMVPPVQYDQTVSQYDQQFFIGTTNMPVIAPPQPVRAPVPFGQPTPVPPPAAPTMPTLRINRSLFPSTSLPSPNSECNTGHRIEDNFISAKDQRALEETDKRALSKLLEDKKISLSDFLTITARPSASRSVDVQEKINIISRCQDVIRELGGDAKSTGRLFIKRYPRPETLEPRQYASPLRKIPVVRLNFTSMVKPDTDMGFSATLKKLLRSVSLFKEIAVKKDQFPRVARSRPPRRRQRQQQAATVTQSVDATTPAKQLAKMCQTDPYKCEVCQVRAARIFQNQMVQCDIKRYADASTQTVSTDSTPLKNKSLSHMTPAEILAELEPKPEVKTEPRSDDETEDEDGPDPASILKNKERSIELDHGDKDLLEPKKPRPGDERYTVWNRGRGNFSSGSRGGGSAFRGSRGFKSQRGNTRKPNYADDFDIYSPNFEDDEEYVFNRSIPAEQQFRSFDDDYYNHSGPSNQRPFFEPPENVKRKFNRRFL